MIDLLPLFHHWNFLLVFLTTLETTITVLVAPIIIIIMLRAYAMRNAGGRWEMAMMRLSMKTPSLSQCPPLPVFLHSLSSLLISDRMLVVVMAIVLLTGRTWHVTS